MKKTDKISLKVDRGTHHALQLFGKAAGLLDVKEFSFSSLVECGLQNGYQFGYYYEDGVDYLHSLQFVNVSTSDDRFKVPIELEKVKTITIDAALYDVLKEKVVSNPACKKWQCQIAPNMFESIDLTNVNDVIARQITAVEFAALANEYANRTGSRLFSKVNGDALYEFPGPLGKKFRDKHVPYYMVTISTVFCLNGVWKIRYAWILIPEIGAPQFGVSPFSVLLNEPQIAECITISDRIIVNEELGNRYQEYDLDDDMER